MGNLKENFNQKDLELLKTKNISIETIEYQYNFIQKGVLDIQLYDCATVENGGIKRLTEETANFYKDLYNKNQNELKIVKFVPASGAATRMFKDLFDYLNTQNYNHLIIEFIENLKSYAFYRDLEENLKTKNKSLEQLILDKNYKEIISNIIGETGLNYGNLPKALIKFHKYKFETRTAFEEHITESVLYAKSDSGNNLHFTVSPEHLSSFENLSKIVKPKYEKQYNIKLNIDFSVQNPSTDTISVTKNKDIFRLDDNSIYFRPGGHGALIHNLNQLDFDIIFIKNIDNVVPDKLKENNCVYKKALAGILIETQQKIFEHIDLLLHKPSIETIEHSFDFLHNTLSVKTLFNFSELTKNEKIEFLLKKLNRPIRICGMVKNEGEPGGGPFFVEHEDGTASLQIVEKSQLNLNNSEIKTIFEKSTHFNPVDIVLSPKKYDKNKFNLLEFIDPNTAFIVEKTIKGTSIKALELPGLWNGAMSDWNTIFIEMPGETFNPVKTVFDLRRENHQ